MALALSPRADLPVYPRQKEVFALNTVFLIIAILAVALRFLGRHIRSIKPGIDDVFIVIALIAFIVQAGLVYPMVLYGGVGNPTNALTADEAVVYTKYATAVQFPYGFAMAFTRYSIVALLIKVFAVSKFRIVCYAILAAITANLLQVIIAAAILCQPFAKNWDKTITYGHCGDPDTSYIAIVAVGIFIDLLIFCSPIPMVWRLQMPVERKVATTLVFALGLVDILIAVFRIVVTSSGYLDVIVPSLILGAGEPAVAILVACCPMYRPLIDKIFPGRILGSTNMSRGTNNKPVSRSARAMDDDAIMLTEADGSSTFALTSGRAQGASAHDSTRHKTDHADGMFLKDGEIGVEHRVDVFAD